jgi:hypothetical protein
VSEKKPHTFVSTTKPFKVEIDLKQGMLVTGYSENRDGVYYYSRFTRPVVVKKGDVFQQNPKKGFILNGKLHLVNMKPAKKQGCKMGWAPKRLRVAVFTERDPIWNRKTRKFTGKYGKPYWCAMDTRGYWLGTGVDVETAIRRLLQQVQFTQLMDKEERQKGVEVTRWHVERQKDVRETLREAEEKAKKTGFILEGIDWQNSLVGKAKFRD